MRRPPAALRTFLQPYGPEVRRLFLATRELVLGAAPQANELLYDAYNAVAVAYSFTDRLREAFCHVAAYRSHVNLGFNRGASLTDPEQRLVGSGAQIRHIRIAAVETLRDGAVQRLVGAAIAQARSARPEEQGGPRSVVKAVHGRKRRPPTSAR